MKNGGFWMKMLWKMNKNFNKREPSPFSFSFPLASPNFFLLFSPRKDIFCSEKLMLLLLRNNKNAFLRDFLLVDKSTAKKILKPILSYLRRYRFKSWFGAKAKSAFKISPFFFFIEEFCTDKISKQYNCHIHFFSETKSEKTTNLF